MNDLELGNQHYINKEYDVAKECYDRILEIDPTDIHQRVPLFIGSTAMVEKAEDYMAKQPQLQS
jgi:fructose-1,6-bisphosphatase